MRRVRLGLSIGSREYEKRFASCLMNHYREQIELHLFSQEALPEDAAAEIDALVAADRPDFAPDTLRNAGLPVVYLYDDGEAVAQFAEKGVILVDKYQEVNRIVDEILKQIGEEIKTTEGGAPGKRTQVLAVYTLSESELQLPFAVTLSSILSEKERVLLFDLQENSGLSQLLDEECPTGMEELFVMAESGKYSRSRLLSCIGHLEHTDVVYPLGNTECLCEIKGTTYQKLFALLSQELQYTTIVLNLGSRFLGFFELLGSCREIYLMKSRGGLGRMREKEFFAEMDKHGDQASGRLREIPMPLVTAPVSCERLVEQWKWNELGDSIRRTIAVG